MPRSRPSFRALQCLYGASPFIITRTARCVLYYNTILPRGPAARPRWIPPACGASPALSPVPRHRNVWPLHRHSGGASMLPRDPHGSPEGPTSSRLDRDRTFAVRTPHRGRLRFSPCTPIDPPAPRLRRTSQRAFAPFGNLTNPPRIGCAPAFRRWITTPLRLRASSGRPVFRHRLRAREMSVLPMQSHRPSVRRLDLRQAVSPPARRPGTVPGSGTNGVRWDLMPSECGQEYFTQ